MPQDQKEIPATYLGRDSNGVPAIQVGKTYPVAREALENRIGLIRRDGEVELVETPSAPTTPATGPR
jgi:hypothetical protein